MIRQWRGNAGDEPEGLQKMSYIRSSQWSVILLLLLHISPINSAHSNYWFRRTVTGDTFSTQFSWTLLNYITITSGTTTNNDKSQYYRTGLLKQHPGGSCSPPSASESGSVHRSLVLPLCPVGCDRRWPRTRVGRETPSFAPALTATQRPGWQQRWKNSEGRGNTERTLHLALKL